jgi:hypothetical protein
MRPVGHTKRVTSIHDAVKIPVLDSATATDWLRNQNSHLQAFATKQELFFA